MSVVFGKVNHNRNAAAYQNSLWIMFGMAITCVGIGMWVIYLDNKDGKIIDMPENDPRVKVLRQKKAEDFDASKKKDKKNKN